MTFYFGTFLLLDTMNVTTATPQNTLTEINPSIDKFKKMFEDINKEILKSNELHCEFII